MSKTNLCVLFGGASSEHEVSRVSAASVTRGLDSEKYSVFHIGITKSGEWFFCPDISPDEIESGEWETRSEKYPCTFSVNRAFKGIVLLDRAEKFKIDVVFPVLHGENGEDGRVQGMLELAGVPCVGPGCLSSAVCMDKSVTKLIAATVGVRQADWVLATAKNFDEAVKKTEERFKYPVFIKPAGTGSSVGASKAKTREELVSGIRDALKYDKKVLVEEYINAREIETAVLGNDAPEVSVCGEIIPSREFYTYESKYIDNTSETIIPAPISAETSEKIRAYAKKIYGALGCRGLSRVDFFVEKRTGDVLFNEINTIPGFTSISMYAKLFEACGIKFPELLDRLIAFAAEE